MRNPLMRSCLVEVGDVAIEYALELPFMQDQQMVQTLLAHTPHEPLSDRIRSGSMIGRFEHLDVTCPRHTSKERPKFAIIITNQVLWRLPIRGRFPERYAPPRHQSESVSRRHGSLSVTRNSMRKKAKSGRKNRSVTCKKSHAQISAA